MTALSRRAFVGLAACGCLAVASSASAQGAPAPSPSGKYVCPPCGCAMDGKDFDAPGVCPAPGCGMELQPKPQAEAPPKP
jgi:hypothetical protein